MIDSAAPAIGARTHRLRSAVIQCLVAALLATTTGIASASPHPPDPDRIRKTLAKRGLGTKVRINETDGTHIIGVLTALRDDDFDITPRNTSQPTTIPYTQVKKVQSGMTLEDAANKSASHVQRNVLIGVGTAALVLILFVVVKN